MTSSSVATSGLRAKRRSTWADGWGLALRFSPKSVGGGEVSKCTTLPPINTRNRMFWGPGRPCFFLKGPGACQVPCQLVEGNHMSEIMEAHQVKKYIGEQIPKRLETKRGSQSLAKSPNHCVWKAYRSYAACQWGVWGTRVYKSANDGCLNFRGGQR